MSVCASKMPRFLLEAKENLSKSIEFENYIEKGANGYVLIGRNTLLNRKVVVKFYYWGGGDHLEPALLAKMKCANILEVLDASKINDEDAFFITPFCENGDLDDAISSRRFGPVEALDVMMQIAAGVSFLHGSNYLHRDLKPSNIFCTADYIYVIGDFGSVVEQNEEGYAQTLTKHSLLYRPPEEIQFSRFYRAGDIYQLGLVFFQILGGHLPYEETAWLKEPDRIKYDALNDIDRQFFARDVIEKRIIAGKIIDTNSLPQWVPKNLKSIIRQACATNHEKRFSSVADFISKLHNIRPSVPDWRIDESPVLKRSNKEIRVVNIKDGIRLEKRVTGAWRKVQNLSPSTLGEAVKMAETL